LTGTKPEGTAGICAGGGGETGSEPPEPSGGEVGPGAPVAGEGVGVPPGGGAGGGLAPGDAPGVVGGTASGALTVTRSATGGLRILVRGFAAAAEVRVVVWAVECELLDLF
jgi:hypothetical protein